MKMRFKSCFFFLVTMYSGKLFAEDKPCDLPHIENGKIAQYYYSFKSYYFPMHKEKKLSYSCMIGYTTESGTQDGRITCTAKGWSPVPRCYKKCSKPLLENGFFYGTETYFKIEEKLQYKCNPGYHTPSGGTEDTVQCQPEGWSSQPSCAKKIESCQVPNLHHGSYFTDRQELRLNETLLYRCDEGYHTAGGNTTEEAVCLTHGWSLPPNCTKITCSSLSAIAHGGFYPVKKIYEEGDVVHFFCEENYSVTVFDLIQCYYFGWYPDPPVCEGVKNKCPPPPLPPHAHIITVKRTYHNGDKARIQCQSTVETEIQCVEGKWSSPPICIGAMDKREPEAPPPLEAQAAVRTSKTYHDEDTKMQQNCTSPPVIKNGVLLGPLLTSYKNGSSVEYSCQRYHFLEGPSTVYCEQGNWTEQPMCLEPCTLNVTDLDSNNIELKWRQEELIFLHGDLVEFECKQGYNFLQTTVLSPGRTQCNHGRLKYPKCILQAPTEKCDSPPSIANGALTLPPLAQYDSGSSVQYSCSDYHFLQGSETIYCSEGQWTSPPVCIEPCTLSKDEMEKNNVLLQGFYGNQVYFYHGDYVGFYCKQNHFGAESGTTLFQVQCKRGQLTYPRCIERGKYLEMALLSCTVVFLLWLGCTAHEGTACEDPPVIDFGEIISGNKSRYMERDRVQYMCNAGFTLSGSEWVTCHEKMWVPGPPQCLAPCIITKQQLQVKNLLLSDGQRHSFLIQSGRWQKFMCVTGFKLTAFPIRQCFNGHIKLPSCVIERPCGSIPKVANAQIEGRNKASYEPGETVSYQCDEGFLIVGTPEIICREGNWTAPPFCEDVTCGTAPEIPNAHITSTQQERYLPGARVQYECESNFQMMDINYVTCTNGQWSRAPTCRDVTCEPPPEIAGGKIEGVKKSRYLPGESARYQCWRGFQMTGSASVTCRTGNWTELPKCKGEGGKCGPPPVIKNGDLLSSPMQEYSPGTTLEYKCPSLYLLEGSQYITCTDGQWTSPPVCLVACTSSEEDMSSNNIELKWVRGRKLYSASGDFVEFKCRRGYVKDPASSPFRVQCVEGTLEYPRCKPGRNCILDKSTMEGNHIQLQSSKLSSMSTYRSGDYIDFECKWWHQKVSRAESFRAECLDGVIQYPTCEYVFG
ncbi:coagulation factor XIII B chain [Columba livia]|uniref:coagulation factor XIII B chain n=1 Tax=Columba livia TaxID=8932 RepID=UPI0031BB1D26